MVSEVRRVGVLRAGKVGLVLYGLLGLVFFPFAMMAALADSRQGVGMLLMVALYPLLGMIGCIIGAALYNLTAKIAGGMQLDFAPTNSGNVPTAPPNDTYQQP